MAIKAVRMPNQGKADLSVIEGFLMEACWLPTFGCMAVCTGYSEHPCVLHRLLVAGNTFPWRFLVLVVCMAIATGDCNVSSGEREAGGLMVEARQGELGRVEVHTAVIWVATRTTSLHLESSVQALFCFDLCADISMTLNAQVILVGFQRLVAGRATRD
ncbi:MAG: hypothetical protein PHQ40_01415 [Anaerolineaceae bacterium]|nr:hypothetical protein [Anaerolineaceae bacterium]